MRLYTLGKRASWLVCIAFICVFSGCSMLKARTSGSGHAMETNQATAAENNSTANENLPYFHQVRWEGETLSLIAKWYTGDWRNWQALAEVNPWVEPNKMYTGVKVKIPRQLLKKQEPMPQDFVLSSDSEGRDGPQSIQENHGETLDSAAGAKAKGSYMEFVVP